MLVVNTTEFGPLGLKFVFEDVVEHKEVKRVTHAVIVLNPYEPQDGPCGQECVWGTAFLHPNDKFFKEDGRVTALERAISILTMSNKRDNRTRREILGGYYLRDVPEDFQVKMPSYSKVHGLNKNQVNTSAPVSPGVSVVETDVDEVKPWVTGEVRSYPPKPSEVKSFPPLDTHQGPTSVEEETGF